MCSIPLVRLGHNVTILERSPTPLLHNQGAGVVAGGETQAFFNKHDRTKRNIAVTSQTRLYLNKKGDKIDRQDTVQRMTSWDLLYYLGRANFDGVDSEYLEGKPVPRKEPGEGMARYEHGRVVTAVKEFGEELEITFKDTRADDAERPDKEQECIISADFLIAADGPSSSTKRLLLPDAASRTYAGYVAFRGTVPETAISQGATEVFVERFTFYHTTGCQILAYTIPGPAGTLAPGTRLVNWVWYVNHAFESPEYKDLMTDTSGKTHRYTLPTGGQMRPEIWARQKEIAGQTLPPQFAELVHKTASPFVQAITDVAPPAEGTYFAPPRLLGGKAVLVGDALSGFRPHTAASTSQAAFHALMLEGAFEGRIGWEEYEREVWNFANGWQRRGVLLGERSQFGRHPLSD